MKKFLQVEGLPEKAARRIIDTHFKSICGIRDEQLEKLILFRLIGVRGYLVEETDGRKTTWTFRLEDSSDA